MSIVYILTNEAMPGYIKIGRTDRNVLERMSSLDTTGVPLPFQCYFAARVAENATVEKVLHTAFGDARVRNSREFFRMDPYKARVILEHIAIEDVTPNDDFNSDSEDREALEKATRRGSRFDLFKYTIPVGATLEFTSDRSITCTVVDATTVDYQGQQVSISRAAVLANQARGGKSTGLTGPIWWLYGGETLASIRERLDEGW